MGSDPQPAQVIPAPAPPQGSQGGYQQTAGEVAQAKLQYDPQLTAQAYQLQQQYAPLYAQSQYDIAQQYGPLYKQLTTQLFPQISQLEDITAQQLGSTSFLTPEQQAAQDAIRQRSREQIQQNVRSSANLGGTLYGGNRELQESRALGEFEQATNVQDIALQQQQQQQAMSNLSLLFQLAFPNVQNPTVNQPTIGGDPNALYNALVQNQGNFGIIPGVQGQPSPWWQFAGQVLS